MISVSDHDRMAVEAKPRRHSGLAARSGGLRFANPPYGLQRLNALGAVPREDQRAAIEPIILEEANRIYRMMRLLAAQFAATQKGDPVGDRIITVLKAMVEGSGGDKMVLSANGQCAMTAAFVAVVDDLGTEIAAGSVDMDYLWSLFSGGRGAGIVGGIMFDIVQESI